MRRTRQPSREAQLSPDELSACERADTPGQVRLYRREVVPGPYGPVDHWCAPQIVPDFAAPEWYKVGHDTSD